MTTEIEIRRNDKDYLFQMLVAQHESSVPKDFNRLISQTKAKMEAEDVKLVLQEFEEWKKG
ncbi:MAG: hypothetical protein LBS19_00520 [Clostridiales bacterium]|jgi:hypothetical protein|nr:hypothetical protein [Clostridiales bacterium]